jgi:peptidoglycan/LPS O-acetylase OafA/YrhL
VTAPDVPAGGIPEELTTGFWMWVVALPLMLIGYVLGVVSTPGAAPAWLVYSSAALTVAIIGPIVLTFLILMRRGYRWARSVLTGGGAASVVYVVSHLFGITGTPALAVGYAATTIIGTVLIVGGAVLLHRKDAHGYLVR